MGGASVRVLRVHRRTPGSGMEKTRVFGEAPARGQGSGEEGLSSLPRLLLTRQLPPGM